MSAVDSSASVPSPPPPPASHPSSAAGQAQAPPAQPPPSTRTLRLQQLPRPAIFSSLKTTALTRRQQLLLAVLVPLLLALLAHSLLSRHSSSTSSALSPLTSLLHRLTPARFRSSSPRPSVHPSPSSPLPPTWRLVNNTAEGVALFRYLSALDPSSPITPSEKAALELLLPPHLLSLAAHPTTRQVLRRGALPGVYEAVEGRTVRIDDTLHRLLQPRPTPSGPPKPTIEQVVILGAGSDTRALRFHPQLAEEGVVVFEVDLPDTQARKRERLGEGVRKGGQMREKGDLQAAIDNIRYVPLNLSEAAHRAPPTQPGGQTKPSAMSPLWEGLHGEGYSDEKPTLFILEGLTAYLPPAVVNDTLHSLHHHTPPASVVVLDYFAADPECKAGEEVKVMLETLEGMDEPVLFVVDTEVEKAGEEWRKKHRREMAAWLSANGWHLVELEGPEELQAGRLTGKDGDGDQGNVACYERLLTARNKPVEIEVDIIEV